MMQDYKLSFEEQLKAISVKANKTVRLIHNFLLHFPINYFIAIHKSFFRPHLDFDDAIYDKEIKSIYIIKKFCD